MATIKEATDKFVKEFLIPNKGVYGASHFPCPCCDKPYIEVTVDENIDKNVLSKIPSKYMGFRVEKKFGQQAVAQRTFNVNEITDKKSKDHVIAITPKGTLFWQKNVLTGAYIPEDISILLEVKNEPKMLSFLRKSKSDYKNLDGLLMYLHAKGLVAIDGMTSLQAQNFSNAGGRRSAPRRSAPSRVAPRRIAPRRIAPRRVVSRTPVRRHVNYVRRNYNRFYTYPVAVAPVVYYYDVQRPKRITITQKGLRYLSKHSKGEHVFLLGNIKNGLVYDETLLKNSLKIADFNRVVGWLYGNRMIKFV